MANRFSVRGTFHDFRLVDNVTGREACMGDGTDRQFDIGWLEPTGEDPMPSSRPSIGSEGFRQEWEDEINEDPDVFEAYFPDLYDLVIFDNDDFIDRYTVILHPAHPLERSMHNCPNLCNCLGLSINPDSPGGFSQWGMADPVYMAEKQERVHFLDLPENVQAHIARRLEDD